MLAVFEALFSETLYTPIETHAEAPTKEVKVEAEDLSQLTIQDLKVVAVRVVGVALFIKFEEVEGAKGRCFRRRG